MSQDIHETGPINAGAVREAKFQLIRRGGYDPAQVDPFLELIAQTLEGGPNADPRLNSDYIHGVRFTTVRRGGYLPTQVDRFLDRVISTFDERSTSPVAVRDSAMDDAPGADDSQARNATSAPPASVAPVSAVPDAPASASEPEPTPGEPALDSPEADFDRLRALHRSGVLSDKEFAVLGARVKRRINAPSPASEVSV